MAVHYSFYRPHARVLTTIEGESMTKQSHKAECDIHNILNQYKRTGIIKRIAESPTDWGELPDPIDYQESLHIIRAAEEGFATLPSSIRQEYSNDPAQFLVALRDPLNAKRFIELGIFKTTQLNPPSPPFTPPPPSSK